MRPTTEVCLVIRHVGEKAHEDEFYSGTASSVLKTLVEFVAKNSLASRMEFTIFRNEIEARAMMNPERNTRIKANVFDDIDTLWDEIGKESE